MPQRFSELIGRAMIDPEFLSELQRSPDAALAEYELTDEERAVITHALARLPKSPAPEDTDELRSVLLRRVAT